MTARHSLPSFRFLVLNIALLGALYYITFKPTGDMTDIISENQAWFDKIAHEYDQRNAVAVAQLERMIRGKVEFIGATPDARLLDYACGTGMLSRALGPYVGECVGIDLSENMVGAYNAQARAQNSPRKAYRGNLADPSESSPSDLSDPKLFDFDVAGVGLGWHHFEDCDLAAKRLAGRLRPGGVFFILDFVAHKKDAGSAAGRGITHHGFSEQQVKSMFEGAGLGEGFAYEEFSEPIVFPRPTAGNGHTHEGHAHNHEHNHGHDHGHGNEGGEGGEAKRFIFIARGSKS